MLWPAKVSASNVNCTTMPMAMPIMISCTAASTPAPEKIDRPSGTGASGDRMKASPIVSAIFTGAGTVASLAIGAVRTKPPIRSTGHHRRATHRDTSAASIMIG